MSFRAEGSFSGESTTMAIPANAATLSDVSCTVLSVRTRPFAVPRGLLTDNVSCQVTDAPGSSTVSILVTKTLHLGTAAEQQAARGGGAAASGTGGEDGGEHGGGGSRPHTPPGHVDGAIIAAPGFDPAAFTQSAVTDSSSSIIIQKIALSDPITVWRCARYLKLASHLSPRVCPNVLPLIAAYRHGGACDTLGASSANLAAPNTSALGNSKNNISTTAGGGGQQAMADPLARLIDPATAAVYIAQPHVSDTLAAVARAAPCSAVSMSQIRTIAREVLDALALLHRSGVVVNDINPGTVRVNVALKSRADVAIALSRPMLAGQPMNGQRFLQLLQLPKFGHRYLAPEVVLQVVRASTARAAMPEGANPATFSHHDGATVTVTPAADIFSLACVLVELVTGRPLFAASNSIFEHGPVVAEVLGAPFPQRVPATAGNPNPSRVGVFTGVPMSGQLLTALAATDASFRQFVSAMLQMDPHVRPTAEECIRSPFVSLGIAGNIAGGGAGVRAHGGAVVNARIIGGRRNSGTSSGSRPQPPPSGDGTSQLPHHQQKRSASGAARSGGGGSIAGGENQSGLGGPFDLPKDWALPEPGEQALQALMEASPLMP